VGTIAAKYDWATIKAEYISGNISLRDLAAKHGIPFSTIRDRALKEGWAKERESIRNKLLTRTVQKTTDRIATSISKSLAKEYEIADKLANVLSRALEDPDQFNRHLVVKKVKMGNCEKQCVEELQFDKVDMRAVAEAAKSLQVVEAVKRSIAGILTEAQKERLRLEREKLEIEKARAEKDTVDKSIVVELSDELDDFGG